MTTQLPERTASPARWRPYRRSALTLFLAHGGDPPAKLVLVRVNTGLQQHRSQPFGAHRLALDTDLLHEGGPAGDEISMAFPCFADQLVAQRVLVPLGFAAYVCQRPLHL